MSKIFELTSAEMRQTEPDAGFRRVGIQVFDSKETALPFGGTYLAHLLVGPNDEATEFDPSKIEWNWRDPATRPSESERQLMHEYRMSVRAAAVEADRPFVNDAGVPVIPRSEWTTVERRQKELKQQFLVSLARSHQIPLEGLCSRLARVALWEEGRNSSDPALLATYAATFLPESDDGSETSAIQ
ncbi:hypothetical protein SH661x_000385 [Planctomicrobium sp. SH661]|uniref:hypothetical protein n=1 Tax=Planctomicrobium sp. SH661 TaxID=3448124 RepID=UPI003F5B4709